MFRYSAIAYGVLLIFFSVSAQDEFFEPNTIIGGYGELHYNYSDKEGYDPEKQLDFHRFVLFLSHAWTEKISFKSEVELEHNFVKDGQGELELEQAYVDYRFSDRIGFRAGVVLPSVGLVNEYHEPPTFFGVERPTYNKLIIPTTWFGNGVSIYGNIQNFDYKFTVMEGLDGSGFSAENGIRNGRVKGYKANAEELLYNFRIDYLRINGLKLGFSYSTNNAIVSDSTKNAIELLEIHFKYAANNLYAVFEYGNISYDRGEIKNSMGYYFDLGYNIGGILKINGEFIPFLRWSDYNTASNTRIGGDSEKQFHYTEWMFGFSYKPIPQVVYKLDFGSLQNELDQKRTILFNLGVGYMF